jgi:hypothetical protein
VNILLLSPRSVPSNRAVEIVFTCILQEIIRQTYRSEMIVQEAVDDIIISPVLVLGF